jgi:hypothetical protein
MPLPTPVGSEAGGAPVAPQTDSADTSSETTPSSVAETSEKDTDTGSPAGSGKVTSETPEADTEQDRAVLNRLAKEEGLDLRGKYRNDAEFLRSYRELQGALSKRDEDAAIGKMIRGKEQDVLQFLKSQQSPPSNGKTQERPQWEAYQLLEARVLDPSTGQPRSGARPEDVQQLQDLNKGLLRAAYEIAYHPENLLGGIVEKKVAEAKRQWEQEQAGQTAQQTENQMLATFEDSHKDWMFANKRDDASGYTPQGYRFLDLCQEIDTNYRRMGAQLPMSALERLAYEALSREQPDSTPSASVAKPQARRRASATTQQPSIEDHLRKMVNDGVPMSEAVARLAEMQG